MEGKIPGGIPGVFPLVGHRDDVVVIEMTPVRVAAGLPSVRRRKLVTIQPARDVVMIELLAPYHSGKRLPHHGSFVGACVIGCERRIIFISFTAPIGKNLLEAGAEIEWSSRHVAHEAKPELDGLSGGNRDAIPACHLGAVPGWIDRRCTADDVIVD